MASRLFSIVVITIVLLVPSAAFQGSQRTSLVQQSFRGLGTRNDPATKRKHGHHSASFRHATGTTQLGVVFVDSVVSAVGGTNPFWSRFFTVPTPLWDEPSLRFIQFLIHPNLFGGIVEIALSAIVVLYVISFPPENFRDGMEPYPRGEYDPEKARQYYYEHKFLVLQRFFQVFRLSNSFLLNLAMDKYIFRDEDQQRPARAQQLLELVTLLGPTAIKIGQSLSVRSDLIDEEYAKALATLQDRVPAFSGSVARKILLSELGEEKFSHLKGLGLDSSSGPVASASIGQVYRGFIDDKEVAVKVQRPNVLSEIALDLFLVRELAPVVQKINGGTNLQELANEWGRGFIAELDYKREAASTILFNEEMQKRNLNAVCAPNVVEDYSTQRILVTQWIRGTRLDQSDEADVPRLCAVALNAYLVMLLEMQALHCDPHPGNLLRTEDGKLCILDFGMTLEIDPNLQYSLLEYIAHLTAESYDELPEDFVKLGFLKPDKLEFMKRSGAMEPLKYFLRQVNGGGGAKAFRERILNDFRAKYPGKTDEELREAIRDEFKEQAKDIAKRESVATGLTTEVEDLQRRNRDSFRIPPWFVYTSRAFVTLEGVSLKADENYSLIKSCFPYIAKRLLADDDPRARKALRDLIYGAGDMIDVERLSELADGFSSYTTTTKTINTNSDGAGDLALVGYETMVRKQDRKTRLVETEATITLVKDSADVLLAPKGNLVQNLLVEESALALSAQVKDAMRMAMIDTPQAIRASLPFGLGALVPRSMLAEQVEPFLRKTPLEVKAQELAEKIALLVPNPSSNGIAKPVAVGTRTSMDRASPEIANIVLESLRGVDPEEAALVLKELRENLPIYVPQAVQLGEKFVVSLLDKAAANIDNTLLELEKSGTKSDPLFSAAMRQVSTVTRSATNSISNSRGGD